MGCDRRSCGADARPFKFFNPRFGCRPCPTRRDSYPEVVQVAADDINPGHVCPDDVGPDDVGWSSPRSTDAPSDHNSSESVHRSDLDRRDGPSRTEANDRGNDHADRYDA